MCTLVVAAQAVPDEPLVVVANRDEEIDRASSPPRAWEQGFFAPRDEVAGGTWLGVNPHGVFVGITNRYLGPRDAARASRGELAVRALTLASAREIHDAMREVDPKRYNGFHLVYADERDVLATIADGEALAQVTLGRGVTIVTERSFGAGDDRARVARIRSAWGRLAPARQTDRLTELLTEHDDADPLAATCVHVPAIGYATRSAMVLTRRDARWRMWWAEGPPCTTPFVEISPETG